MNIAKGNIGIIAELSHYSSKPVDSGHLIKNNSSAAGEYSAAIDLQPRKDSRPGGPC